MWTIVLLAVLFLLLVVAAYDLLQRNHAILRNFPIVGHFRYLFELVGPELRQYIVTGDNEERPFSRDQRRWVYASSKKQNNYFGFGTDNDLELSSNYLIIKHSAFPIMDEIAGESTPGYLYPLPCAKVLGGSRGREKAFRPASVINISGMSYGSLSAAAIEALNCGSAICECLHNTGEGGVSPYHLKGGELVWQIGTGYFGCRNSEGGFDRDKFIETCASGPVRAIEIKLSQGAKPGLGGLLPASKVSSEISRIRGVPLGKACYSPPAHTAFSDVDSQLDFVEDLATETGLPVGIKSAVGEISFWRELAHLMATTDRGVDFIAVDGGEGGTGAAPLAFSDHVALPFKIALSRVYREFAQRNLQQDVVFIGSGKLGFPETSMLGFSLGCDMVNVGREAMLAIGCIQAQRCHTGHCPTGVATQSAWLMRGLDPTHKAHRLANYVLTLRKELTYLSRACGVRHPALVVPDHFEILDDRFGSRNAQDVFGYEESWSLPAAEDQDVINEIMQG
ncbi:MAG: FMN-binding glutamate synthase family protein [Planctomycetota bacterium]|nr:FMN-binding glutamate synthase family protein [Planctomycetota bacterium]